MKKETLQNILALLNRVNLTGAEVPVFNQVVTEILADINKQTVTDETK